MAIAAQKKAMHSNDIESTISPLRGFLQPKRSALPGWLLIFVVAYLACAGDLIRITDGSMLPRADAAEATPPTPQVPDMAHRTMPAEAEREGLRARLVLREHDRMPDEPDSAAESHEHVAGAHGKHQSVAAAPVATQPQAKIFVNPPLPGPLARGVVFIQYRTENLQLAPVFGPAAVAISPRVGHLHVTVDDAPWHWADAGGGPVIVSGLPSGSHQIVIELADANHHPLAQEAVKFEIP